MPRPEYTKIDYDIRSKIEEMDYVITGNLEIIDGINHVLEDARRSGYPVETIATATTGLKVAMKEAMEIRDVNKRQQDELVNLLVEKYGCRCFSLRLEAHCRCNQYQPTMEME
tara:strand:+ start:1449 stop:1787 length:339 start_codon:yes stop_codon:yes gene_type:complete